MQILNTACESTYLIVIFDPNMRSVSIFVTFIFSYTLTDCLKCSKHFHTIRDLPYMQSTNFAFHSTHSTKSRTNSF